MIRASYLFLLLGCFLNVAKSEEMGVQFTGNVPKEIARLMLEKDCSPIEKFYDRDVRLPPFVYHDSLFDGETAIIFACEIDNSDTDDKFQIVLIRKKYSDNGLVYSDFADCSSEIKFRHMPGGLTISSMTSPLEFDYNFWENTKSYIWDQAKPKDAINGVSWMIEERQRGGVGYGLFCFRGDWYNISFD